MPEGDKGLRGPIDAAIGALGLTPEGGLEQQVQTEAPPQETETVEPVLGGAGPPASTRQGVISDFSERFPQTRPAGGPFTASGEIVKNLSPQNQALLQQSVGRLQEAEFLRGAEDLRAMNVSEAAQRDFANLAADDAIRARQLTNEHFPAARQKLQELQQKVDDARAMRVNPYNWHESIGRGGRVAAAFSVLTGQLAAGAGNPNSSLKMMESAIERDISAQEQNIKNEFNALKTTRGLLQDERALFDDQFNALNETRAVAYSAIVGRIGAAKQHAANEGHYLSLKTMEDHFTMKMLESIAATQRKYLAVKVEGPVKNAVELRSLERQMGAMQAALDQRQQQATAALPAQAPLTTTEGTAAADLGFRAGAPTEAPADAPELPAAPTRAAAVGDRRPPKARPAAVAAEPTPTAGVPAFPVAAEDQVTISPVEREDIDRERAEEAAVSIPDSLMGLGQKAVAAPGSVTRQDVARALETEAGNIPPEVVKAGGYGMAIALQNRVPATRITTLDEALNAMGNGRPLPNGGFQTFQDAQLFADMVPDPKRAQFDDQFKYLEAKEFADYVRDRPEVYEAPTNLEGEVSAIPNPAGGWLKFTGGSVYRGNDAKAITLRQELKRRMAEGYNSVKQLHDQAQLVRKIGFNSLVNWDSEDGMVVKGLNDTGEVYLRNQILTRQAMAFIKSEDPTARLSDKDVEIGERVMGNLDKPWNKVLDLIQSFDGSVTDNGARRSFMRYYQKLAKFTLSAYYSEFKGDFVPDKAAWDLQRDQELSIQKWVETDKKNNE